ncbi:unnamed protein product [Eretmochelys imbricata]
MSSFVLAGKTADRTGKGLSHQCEGIYSPGIPWDPIFADLALCALPCHRKCGDHSPSGNQPSPSHPNVFPSLQFLLPAGMADHSLYPKDTCQPCVPKQIHLLRQLCPTDVFCFLPRMHRDFLLAVMAYDCYLAICYPLLYSSILNSTLTAQLAVGSWLCGFLAISVPAFLITRLSFCALVSSITLLGT